MPMKCQISANGENNMFTVIAWGTGKLSAGYLAGGYGVMLTLNFM